MRFWNKRCDSKMDSSTKNNGSGATFLCYRSATHKLLIFISCSNSSKSSSILLDLLKWQLYILFLYKLTF